MAEAKYNIFSNILAKVNEPLSKEWQTFANKIATKPVTTWPWITTPTKANVNLLQMAKTKAETPLRAQDFKQPVKTNWIKPEEDRTWKMNLQEFWDMIKTKYPDYQNIDSTELWQKMLDKFPDYKASVYTTTPINDMSLLWEAGQRTVNLKDKMLQRWQNIIDIQKRWEWVPLSFWQKIGRNIWVAWQFAWWIWDVIWEWIAYATPDFIKDSLKDAWKEIWGNLSEESKQKTVTAIKEWWESYKQFKQENPYLADTIEWSLNIWWLYWMWKVKDVAKEWTEQVIKQGAKLKWFKTILPDEKTSYNISTKANRFNAKDIEDFVKITWESPWEFAVKRWMTKTWDDAVEESTKNWQASMKQADEALEQVWGNFKIQQWPDFIEWAIEWLQNKLSRYSPKIRRVNELADKYRSEWLTMTEINELKRLYSKNHKYTWVDASGKSALESKDIQDWLRLWQFSKAKEMWLQNLDEINKNTQWWKTFADNLSKKLKRSEWNNNVSITDWISLSWWDITNIALFLGKKAGESSKFKELLIRKLWKQTKTPIIEANVNKPDIKWLLPSWPIITPVNPNLWSKIKVETPKTTKKQLKKLLKFKQKETNDINTNISSNLSNNRMETKLTPKVLTPKKVEVPKVESKPTQIEINQKISEWYKKSANERFAKWDFTQTEIQKGRTKLESLYEWRQIEFDWNRWVIVSKPAFWKVKIKLWDNIKSFDTEYVKQTQKQATIDEIKSYLKTTEYDWYNLKPKVESKPNKINNKGFINPTKIFTDIKNTWSKLLKSIQDPNIPKAKAMYEELVSKWVNPMEAQRQIVDKYGSNAWKGSKAGAIDISKKDVEDFVVLHNLNIDKLNKIKELWWMPWPSLAVTKKWIPFEDFWDITLVWDKNLIQSMKAKTYSADIYSPRVPNASYVEKSSKEIRPILDKIDNELKNEWVRWYSILNDLEQDYTRWSYWLNLKFAKDNNLKFDTATKSSYNWWWFEWYADLARLDKSKLENALPKDYKPNNNYDLYIKEMKDISKKLLNWKELELYFNDAENMYKFLKSFKESPKIDTNQVARNIQKIIEEKWLTKEYEKFIDNLKDQLFNKKLFKGINYSWRKMYKEYSLDNILKDMFSNWSKWTESSIFAWNLSQTMWKEAKALNLKQIKESNIWSSLELDKKYQDLKDKWLEYASFDTWQAISDNFYLNRSNETILRWLENYWVKWLTITDIQDMKKIIQEATNLPKTYLETKFTRWVWLNEFRWVIAPESQIAELKQILKWTWLENKIVGYKKWEWRNAKLDLLQKQYWNIFFNIWWVMIWWYALSQILWDNKKRLLKK